MYLLVSIYYQSRIHLKIIFLTIILRTVLCSEENTNNGLSRQARAIGGASLDTSNFVLDVEEDGSKFIEVPYEFMTEWIKDQKMWRTWSIMLTILCLIFFGVLAAFLVHNFQTSTGPFSLCHRSVNENRSDDKLTSSSEMMDYTQPGHVPMFNSMVDSRHLSSLQSRGQL